MTKTVSNWSDLDSDLLSEIVDRISCLRDFIIFGAVCKSWRSVASPENFNKSTKVPWLLLDQNQDRHCPRKFFDLSKDAVYNLPKRLYKFQVSYTDKRNFRLPSIFQRCNYFMCSKGWYLIVEYETQLSLQNPFLLSRIDLPRPSHLLKYCINYYNFILNIALSSSPSSSSDFTTLILYLLNGTNSARLAFWKNGDRDWTEIDLILSLNLVELPYHIDLRLSFNTVELTHHNGRYYAAHLNDGENGYVVHEIDIRNSSFVSKRTKSFTNISTNPYNRSSFWIVGSSRGLMIIVWRLKFDGEMRSGSSEIISGDIYSNILEFIVEEVDFEKGESKEVKDMGDEALFLGLNSSFFADVSKEAKFKSNHIYFADSFKLSSYHRRGVGVYSMMDRSCKPLFIEADYDYHCSSQWFEPRL